MRLVSDGAIRSLLGLLLVAGLAGCSTPPLQTARANFNAGRFEQAEQSLKQLPPQEDKDTVLYLMERGMIRQNLQQFTASAADWRKAASTDYILETYSLSQGASSLIVNDRVLSFRGMPFERTLLFAFLAKDYLALADWDYAGICARNIIKRLENLDDFPDMPYCRYLAGFCLEMIYDEGNAAIQYKQVPKLLPDIYVDEDSGQILSKTQKDAQPIQAEKGWPNELVCFILIGCTPPGDNPYSIRYSDAAPYAEIYQNDRYLGRSYPLSNTEDLMIASEKRMAAIQLAKDAARIAVKETISSSIEQGNQTLGVLTRLLLFSMEMPDTRRWETLPLWLEVARTPCPGNLTSYTVVFKDNAGNTTGTKTVTAPITRNGNIFFSFCRDIGQ